MSFYQWEDGQIKLQDLMLPNEAKEKHLKNKIKSKFI